MPSGGGASYDVPCPHPSHCGPFHRDETGLQTPKDALRQLASMEIWGKAAPRSNDIQAVRSYRGPLSGRGVEFGSQYPPHPGAGSPLEAKWYLVTPGVEQRPNGFVALPICCFKNGQP